jgi:VanZ family protein
MRPRLHRSFRWVPSVLMMAAIFVLSSVPAADLPQLGMVDFVARKAAHLLGYGLLAIAFWYGLGWKREGRKLAWLLTVLYAATDEVHQSFTPGRHPWWADVLVFDAFGAFLGLWLSARFLSRRNIPATIDD